jgi:hypothetical protein
MFGNEWFFNLTEELYSTKNTLTAWYFTINYEYNQRDANI